MQNEIPIKNATIQVAIDAVGNALSVIEQGNPNALNIVKSKLFTIKDLLRDAVNSARALHPEIFKRSTLDEILAEIKTLELSIADVKSKELDSEALKVLSKLQGKFEKLTKIKNRLIEKQASDPTSEEKESA